MAAARNVLRISGFLGLDLSSPPLSAADGRAVDGSDYVGERGTVRKRKGLVSVGRAQAVRYFPAGRGGAVADEPVDNGRSINGLWQFVAEDGVRHAVAHVGRILMEVTGLGTARCSFSPIPYLGTKRAQDGNEYPVCLAFLDAPSNAFVGGKKLWFLGGNCYAVLRFYGNGASLLPVEESPLVPVPTTTASITYSGAVASERLSLMKANLMTEWRKNTLLTGVGKREDDANSTRFFDYQLDAPCLFKKESDMADFRMTLTERGKIG